MDLRPTGCLQDGDKEIARHGHRAGRSVVAFRGVFWSAFSISVPAAVNLVVFLITSRLLTPADFGAVALAATITMFAASLGPIGFGEALVQRSSLRTDHLDSVFWLCMIFGAAAYVVLHVNAGRIGDLFESEILAVLVPVFGVRILLQMANVVPNALIVRSLSFHLIALRTFMATLIAAAISIALVLSGYGLWALVFSQLSASAVTAGTSFWTAGWRPRATMKLSALRELARYGIFASGNQLVAFLGTKADQAVVGYVLGIRSAGLYNFARRVHTMTSDVVSGSLGTVSHPLFSEVQHDRDKIRRGFLIATFVSSVVSFPIFVGTALVADRAVPLLFGKQWLEAVEPLRLLCAIGLISCIGTLQSSLIKSRGKADWWFYYQLVSSLFNIALVVAFARYGVAVMLLALVAKAYLLWPVSVAMTLQLLSMRLPQYARQFSGPVAATVAMGAAVLFSREFLDDTTALQGLLQDVTVGAVSYAAVLIACAPRRLMDIGGIVRRAAMVR
jgi:O-antigen/teichoic acid export membrane protein